MPHPPHPPHAGPPPPPPAPRAEAMRARFEREGAYRDLRRGAVLLQRMEEAEPQAEVTHCAVRLLALATQLYRLADAQMSQGRAHCAAEYAVAVRDLMRAVEKLHHCAAPAPQEADDAG